MTPSSFDRLTRRAALASSTALTGLAVLGLRTHAQEATPVASPAAGTSTLAASDVDFLFVQIASDATWAPKEGADGTFVLTLTHQDGQTIYFSDRPERIVGSAPTQTVLDGLGFTPADPPNAAIVAGEEVLVVELTNPAYDPAAGTLTYDATPLAPEAASDGLTHLANQQADQDLPADLGPTSLFIDSAQETCSEYKSCYYPSDTYGPDCYAPDPDLPSYLCSAGGIPGGPIDACWDWTAFSCEACDGTSKDALYQLCNDTYSVCDNNCQVDVGN